MRILVTASRTWPDPRCVHQQLGFAVHELCRDASVTIVHGNAAGGDFMAHTWCDQHPRYGDVFVVEEIHRAAWRGPEGRAAGFWRSGRMVVSGIDLCLAFICNQSRGATHCAGLAVKQGIPVRRFHA